MRIFVVENHVDTLRSLRLFLTAKGHRVLTATTLEEARAGFVGDETDVLLCDIGLPDGTGWELLREFRTRPGKQPIAIAMSGYGTPEDRARSAEAGFQHHLLKPFEPTKLKELLAQIDAA